MIEEDFPLTRFQWAKAQALFGVGTSEVTLAAGPPRLALGVKSDRAPTARIAAGWFRLIASATGMINLRWNTTIEGTVSALRIVDFQQPLHPPRSRFADTQGKQSQILFKGPVPPFVLGVVLRTGWSTKLHLDSEPDPFHAQFGEAASTATTKRRPIVDLDRPRQTVALEQLT